jgi:hypothetical protein
MLVVLFVKEKELNPSSFSFFKNNFIQGIHSLRNLTLNRFFSPYC